MGGYGSGRYSRPAGRSLTCERLALDVATFRRQGLDLANVQPEARGSLAMSYGGHTFTWRPESPRALPDGPALAARACTVRLADGPSATVPLSWHPVGFGWRPAFRCPQCTRRARILYAARVQYYDRPPRWTCRACAGLAYTSTRQSDDVRAEVRARRAAAALGAPWAWRCDRATLSGQPDYLPRPYSMRRSLYLRRLGRWIADRRDFDIALELELGRGLGRRVWRAFTGDAFDEMAAARRALYKCAEAQRAFGGRRLARS